MRKAQTISRQLRRNVGGASETTRQAPSVAECRAYLLGALHDGTFNRYNQRHRFAQLGTDWLSVLKSCLALTDNTSWIYREGRNRKVYVLETRAKFLDTKFDPKRLNSAEEKIAYLRGFFDAEGGIPRSPSARFYIQLVQNDRIKLEKLKQMLISFGIQSGKIHNPSFHIDPDYFRMFISKKSQENFLKIIGSWHPRKIKTLQQRVMI
ncbi:MAG: LAGLIDADG family homing endonuclease [Candidatus Sungbacteria bacterium]|uniref:LAGLIDADG family homing endonuclease n=1 Tax=Candidatus Sungiibacteriota bacterium TaxID=2750080 RepID=A0A9D6QU88_9BACT|nr:LAGLIDADG family homing endonuclease [Candidatus Sungbacteria bacterium]